MTGKKKSDNILDDLKIICLFLAECHRFQWNKTRAVMTFKKVIFTSLILDNAPSDVSFCIANPKTENYNHKMTFLCHDQKHLFRLTNKFLKRVVLLHFLPILLPGPCTEGLSVFSLQDHNYMR